jgi:hypothetical protein
MVVEQFYSHAFQRTSEAFNATQNTISYTIQLAETFVRLNFAGDQLVSFFLPAIEHLLLKDNLVDCSYKIDIWDSVNTGIDFPQAPCGIDNIEMRGEISGFLNDRFESAFFTHSRILSFIDHDNMYGVVCLVDPFEIPAFELSCPFRGIFSWILRRINIIMIHAASIGTIDGSILIGGNSGAGKSSTALRCLIAGLSYHGDDICAVSIISGVPKVYGVYSSGKVLSVDFARFPELGKSNYEHFEELYDKKLFFLNRYFDSQIQKVGLIKAIIIPEQNINTEIGFEIIPKAKVLSIISSSSKLLLPNAGNESYQVLSDILRQVPCFKLNLGNDPSKIAGTLKSFISQIIKGH